MGGEYRKYNVEMTMANDEYKFWKIAMEKTDCIVETYKNKRSIYFAATNLIPSACLQNESNEEYRLMLIGVEAGEIIHKDFGVVYINQRGEGSVFKKFEGPSLECYTHCILVVSDKEEGKARTVLSGQMPFYKTEVKREDKPEEETLWKKAVSKMEDTKAVQIFSKEVDETRCQWYKINGAEDIIENLMSCKGQIEKFGHYILGKNKKDYFVGIPGRFLKAEQPMSEKQTFILWQPIKGAEKFFGNLTELEGKLQEEIFGYWIARIDYETGSITPY